ncbi:transposase [Streptomyces sp. NPDC050674]|uniref:IS110 family transposase n=1 Tax=Streptomyces sp. NPDC050674 TaxID=3157216 RepID=UPI0034409994
MPLRRLGGTARGPGMAAFAAPAPTPTNGVACLRATGRPIHVINPLTAARYALSRKTSDHLDAKVLAKQSCAPTPQNTGPSQRTATSHAITILVRAQQDAIWDRVRSGNRLRSHPREHFPPSSPSPRPPRRPRLTRHPRSAAPTPPGPPSSPAPSCERF